MKERSTHSFELDQVMIDFLEEMTQKYSLPDTNKTLRCLINHARDEVDAQDDIFDQVRCLDC